MFSLQIKKIIRETADTSSFVLGAVAGTEITCKPGQFLTFVFTGVDGKEERRSYSVSSTPVLGEPLQITVKRVANGAYSRWFTDRAKEGDILSAAGASGYFVLPEQISSKQQFVFFAAGSGITPVMSLIKTVLHTSADAKIFLVYSNTSVGSTIFYDELLQLKQQHTGRFEIDFLYSADAGYTKRRLNVGMIAGIADQYTDAMFYLCGPLEYMRTIAIVLRTEGIPEHVIRREIFYSEKPVIREMPPDALPHAVRIILDGKEYNFTAAYPVTILQAAKSLGIPVPYSCEAGQCGTCSATCVSGKVWMWHNDVLPDEEIMKGRVLTCTGYAVGGDVVLTF